MEKTKEELKLEAEQRIKKLAKLEIDDVLESDVSESQLNAKFNKIFKHVRKGLLVIRAKKKIGELKGEELITETQRLFDLSMEL